MKVVAISDTHLTHEKWQIPIPDGDMLIHSGDGVLTGDEEEVGRFNRWFSGFPHPVKIFVAGNHEMLFEKDPLRARSLLAPSIHYLQDSEMTIRDLRIYGSPWTPAFRNWAFNLERGKALKRKWDLIPVGIDILVTHGPPQGIGDEFPGSGPIGCVDLAKAVRKIKPKYHIFGHVHHGYGVYKKRGQRTVYVNASICDENYHPIHQPIVIEI